MVTRTRWKGRMCIEEYHCMQSLGGGSLENDLQWWQELYAREGCALRTTIACRALGGGKFRKWLAIVTRTLWKGRMCIEDYHCMQSFGGGKFRKWLAIATRTLWKGRMCIEDYHCMPSFGGGKFRKWLAIATRTLWKGRMCIEDYHCMQSFGGGSLENDLQSWQELCEREGCALRTTIACRALGGKFRKWLAIVTRTLWKGRYALMTTIACRALGGEVYKKTCNGDKNSMQGKDVHWGIPLHAELWGGGSLKKRLATVRRTLCKGRMCIEEYHRMQSLGGGSLENDLQRWQELYAREGCAFRNTIACRAFRGGSLENDLQPWEELYAREGCALRTTIACRALGGGEFRKWLAIVTRTLWKGRMCIEEYHCMQSFGGGEV